MTSLAFPFAEATAGFAAATRGVIPTRVPFLDAIDALLFGPPFTIAPGADESTTEEFAAEATAGVAVVVLLLAPTGRFLANRTAHRLAGHHTRAGTTVAAAPDAATGTGVAARTTWSTW